MYSDFSLFLPFSLRQDNTHKTSSFHKTSIIILTFCTPTRVQHPGLPGGLSLFIQHRNLLLGLLRYSKHPNVVHTLSKYVVSDENSGTVFKDGLRLLTYRRGQIPATNSKIPLCLAGIRSRSSTIFAGTTESARPRRRHLIPTWIRSYTFGIPPPCRPPNHVSQNVLTVLRDRQVALGGNLSSDTSTRATYDCCTLGSGEGQQFRRSERVM